MTTAPHEMAQEVVDLAGQYQRDSEELSQILTVKAVKWAMWRSEDGCTSDKQADKKWDASREGVREMQLRLTLKASEKKMSALKSMLRILEGEARNQF